MVMVIFCQNYLYYDPLRAQASGHYYGNHYPDLQCHHGVHCYDNDQYHKFGHSYCSMNQEKSPMKKFP